MTATTIFLAPPVDTLYFRCQKLIFATMNAFHTANQIFDNTLNVLHPMVLAVEQDNNKSYTFKQMLQQEDKAKLVRTKPKDIGRWLLDQRVWPTSSPF